MMIRDINLHEMKTFVLVMALAVVGFASNSMAQVTADFSYVQDCEEITFTNESTDGGGFTITGQLWDFGDGNTSTDLDPIHVYAGDGDYLVTLTVSHDGPGEVETTQTVSVWHPDADFDALDECLGQPTSFESTSTSPNSPITSWEWDFDDDGFTDATGSTASWTFAETGPHLVTLTVTNELGCQDVFSKNINVKENPVADFEFDLVCEGSPTSFTDNSTTPGGGGTIQSWSWDFNNDATEDSGDENPTYTFPSGGTFPVFLEVENSLGCTGNITLDVIVFEQPEASFSFVAGCPLEESEFTDESAPGDTDISLWEWDFDDGSAISNDPDPTHMYTANGFYNVLLTVTDENGCQDDTVQEVIQQKPEAGFLVDVVCLGNPSLFENTSTFEDGYDISSYDWDFGDGTGTSTEENPEYTYLNHGEYQVELIVGNELSCLDTATFTVLVDTLPEASFVYNAACEGLPTCFTSESLPNAESIVAWNWNFGDGNSSTLEAPCHIFSSGGTYDVTLTVVNSDGCVSAPFTESVFVSIAPEVGFTYNDVCFGDTTFFQNLTDTFGYQISYLQWDFDDPGSASNNSDEFDPYHLFTSPGDFQVKLVVVNVHGCADSVINTITIDSLPEAKFVMPDSISVDVQFSLTDLSIPHGSNIITWYWDFGDGTSGTNINPITHEYNQTGTYPVCLTVTDFNGCTDLYCDTIVVVGKPQADFSYASDMNLETFFSDESQPSYSIVNWFWNFGDPYTTADTISGTSQPVWQYTVEGWYSVFLEIEDSFGGMHDTTKLIYAGNAVVADYDHFGQCLGDTTVFLDNSYSNLTSTFDNWHWDFGDGSDTTYTEQVDTILHHYEYPGMYQVKFSVSAYINGFFMTDTLIQVVSVFESPSARIDTAGLNVCLGSVTHFNDATPAFLDPVVQWIWDFDTESGDSAFIKSPDFIYADTGAYNVKMTVITQEGCTSIDSVLAHVNTSPEFGFIIENNCINSPTYFIPDYDSSSITITKWHWNFGDELSSENTSSLPRPTHVYDRVAEFTITMTMEAYGCAGESEETVLVYPIPYSQFSLEENYGGIQGKTRFTNSSIYATSYLWDFGNGNTSTVPDPVEIFEYDSLYTITLISYNEYFCSDTSRADLSVFFKGLYFPTAFSPNNPNAEISTFQPKGVNLKDYLVQVFDMRGNLIWESDKVDEQGTPVESWDGYYEGRLMPQGMYIWKAAGKFRDGSIWEGQSFDSSAPQTNGVVTIVR